MRRHLIAEIGINHNGKFTDAKDLIDSAVKSGCTAIKFQYRNIDRSHGIKLSEIGDEIIFTEVAKNYLSPEEIHDLALYAVRKNISPGISFFTLEDFHDFKSHDVFEFYKIPSAELSNLELIKFLLKTGKSVYISTGMHDEAVVEEIFNQIKDYPNWIPFHCVSNYPVALHNANLGYIEYLQNRWNREIGFSSHDEFWQLSIIAITLGATLIERHITKFKNQNGLDHSSSSTPEEFEILAKILNNYDSIIKGNAARVMNQGEKLNRQNLGRSFYAIKKQDSGTLFDPKNFNYRSPKTGISYEDLAMFKGKPIIKDLDADSVISSEHFLNSESKYSEIMLKIAIENKISLPVRLADYLKVSSEIPLRNFEFHLSFKEVLTWNKNLEILDNHNFSLHLPDYMDSTSLIDPWSKSLDIRTGSREIIDKTIEIGKHLFSLTGVKIPIVFSLAGLGLSRKTFFPQITELFNEIDSPEVTLTLQWLPPYAWYFGGAMSLTNMNNLEDISFIKDNQLAVTMDTSHLLLGKNVFNFDPQMILTELSDNIKHLHISDARGEDGEGCAIGTGEEENLQIISSALHMPGQKVLEIWQGHISNFAGFKRALRDISILLGSQL
jgi:sialic acid synthase SpsE